MTAITIEVPNSKIGFITRLINELGLSYHKETVGQVPALYDPETGKYLNEETMRVIREAEAGIGLEEYDSVEDFMKMAEAL